MIDWLSEESDATGGMVSSKFRDDLLEKMDNLGLIEQQIQCQQGNVNANKLQKALEDHKLSVDVFMQLLGEESDFKIERTQDSSMHIQADLVENPPIEKHEITVATANWPDPYVQFAG